MTGTQTDYDLIVLGGGSAGYAGAALAARRGLRTAVVEGGAEVGGLCILKGCMPSKTLLATSERAAAVRKSGMLGVEARFEGVDMAQLQERRRLLVGEFASYRRGQLEDGRFAFLRGMARFLDPHTLAVSNVDSSAPCRLRARFFLVATGSRSFLPTLPGLSAIKPLDSDRFLESESLPSSATILGGGAIALEAASFYAGIGIPVTLLQRSGRILKEADPEVSSTLAEALEARGVTIRTGVTLEACELVPDGRKRVRFHTADRAGAEHVDAAEVLCAMGRTPCTQTLDPGAANLTLSGERLRVGPTQQTSQPHIFGAGDVSSPFAVVHQAIAEAEVAVRNILRLARPGAEPLEETDYRLKMLAVFSDPGFAMVGLSEQEACERGAAVLSASYPFADHGKAMVGGCTEGFVKLIVDARSREILGASVVGPQAPELIHEIATAMYFRATAGDLARIPHYHPTLSEIWTYPAEELA